MTAWLTTLVSGETSAQRKLSIPASTAASSAGSMTAGHFVPVINLLTVQNWRSHPMSVPDVRSKRAVREIMLITQLTEPTLPTKRSFGMPELESVQIRNGCWRSVSCFLRSLPRDNPSTISWLPTRMRLVCQRRPSTTISIPMLSLSRTLICPRK